MSKKLFGLVLALVMALALALPASALSEGEQKAMDRWNGNGVLAGIDTSDPSKSVTRGETAIAFANLLKLEQTASLAGFTDIPAGASYADAMAKCVAAGIFKGNGDGTMTPDEVLSREMFFVVFGRALGFAEQQAAAGSFSDADQISSWAKGMLNALIAKGYVKGVPGNILNPKGSMTIANLASLLDQTIDVYANADGEYTANGNGVALVVAKNVTVKGKTQDLVAAGGAEGGALKLDGLTVNGEAIIETNTAVTTNGTKIANLSFKSAAKLNGQDVAAGYESKDSTVGNNTSGSDYQAPATNQVDIGDNYISDSSSNQNQTETQQPSDEGITPTTSDIIDRFVAEEQVKNNPGYDVARTGEKQVTINIDPESDLKVEDVVADPENPDSIENNSFISGLASWIEQAQKQAQNESKDKDAEITINGEPVVGDLNTAIHHAVKETFDVNHASGIADMNGTIKVGVGSEVIDFVFDNGK